MYLPTTILNTRHHSVRPLSNHRTTGPFALRKELALFTCPYCSKGSYSLSGQARHIATTDCKDRERATLAAEQVRRSLQLDLEVANDGGRASKRVRFTERSVSSLAEANPTSNRTPDNPDIENDSHAETTRQNASSVPQSSRVTHNGGHMYIEHYHNPLAGSPINESRAPNFDFKSYMRNAGSLANLNNFNNLELLMTIGLTNKGRDRVLKSRAYEGQTPWDNCSQMLKDLDKLPHGPGWKVYEIRIKQPDGAVRLDYLFGRNIIEVVRSLIGDWTFKDELRYSPIRAWTTKEKKEQVYSDAWTGNWWWRIQMMIPDKFATIVPLIIAIDKTQLSVMCGGQEAYPVYITIGNIPKSVRRKIHRHATVLLGYLPVDNFPEAKTPDERARLKHQLTHDALAVLMEPLRNAAKNGVVMTCADGRQRRIYPIPAAFEGDWQEQCGMACTDEGGCPVCEQDFNRRSDYPNLAPMRDPNDTLAALCSYLDNDKDPGELKGLRLKPWLPWWASVPYMNFHGSIMPDILHQLHQGMLKTHLIEWTKKVVGIHTVDKCFRAMPGAVGLRHFTRGISRIPGSRWTGRESRDAAKHLLPIVAGQSSISSRFVCLVRSIVDFTYRAHKSQMSDSDIQRLEQALIEFHDKKPVLVALGIYGSIEGLNWIKKLHMLTHYYCAIREMGTPDGYNTELPEHLHIIYAKRGWRASNKVRPMQQMVVFVQRYEAIRIHRMYIDLYYGCQARDRADSRVVYGEDEDAISEGVGRILLGDSETEELNLEPADETGDVDEVPEDEIEGDLTRINSRAATSQCVLLDPEWSIATKPTVSRVTGDRMGEIYGALDFVFRTNEWLQESITAGTLPPLQFVTQDHTFDVWHKFYLHHRPLVFDPELTARRDTVRAQPSSALLVQSMRPFAPGNFDTVLFLAKPKEFGVHRYRIGRVRVIFKLPPHLSTIYPHPLVYIELFTPFSKDLITSHRLHKVSHDMHYGIRRTIVIPLIWVVAACHLVPVFSQFDSDFPFDTHDVLAIGKDFFFNHYSSNFMFGLVDHWRAVRDQAAKAEAAKLREAEEQAKRARAARSKIARARLSRLRASMD